MKASKVQDILINLSTRIEIRRATLGQELSNSDAANLDALNDVVKKSQKLRTKLDAADLKELNKCLATIYTELATNLDLSSVMENVYGTLLKIEALDTEALLLSPEAAAAALKTLKETTAAPREAPKKPAPQPPTREASVKASAAVQQNEAALKGEIGYSLRRLESFAQIRRGEFNEENTAKSLDVLDKFVKQAKEQVAGLRGEDLKVLKEGLAQVSDALYGKNSVPKAMEKVADTIRTVETMLSAGQAASKSASPPLIPPNPPAPPSAGELGGIKLGGNLSQRAESTPEAGMKVDTAKIEAEASLAGSPKGDSPRADVEWQRPQSPTRPAMVRAHDRQALSDVLTRINTVASKVGDNAAFKERIKDIRKYVYDFGKGAPDAIEFAHLNLNQLEKDMAQSAAKKDLPVNTGSPRGHAR